MLTEPQFKQIWILKKAVELHRNNSGVYGDYAKSYSVDETATHIRDGWSFFIKEYSTDLTYYKRKCAERDKAGDNRVLSWEKLYENANFN